MQRLGNIRNRATTSKLSHAPGSWLLGRVTSVLVGRSTCELCAWLRAGGRRGGGEHLTPAGLISGERHGSDDDGEEEWAGEEEEKKEEEEDGNETGDDNDDEEEEEEEGRL